MKIKLSKDEIIRLVNENPCEIYYDHYWDYLKEGDNFKTCAMLEMNCNIEKRETKTITYGSIKQPYGKNK